MFGKGQWDLIFLHLLIELSISTKYQVKGCNDFQRIHQCYILAHLSQRPIGELIVNPCSGVRRPSAFTISNIFFSEAACPIKAKFYVEPPRLGGQNIVCGIWVTCPRWQLRPYMAKTIQKTFPEREGNFHETWYVASGTQAHQSLFK